jgi:hypothetical protein
MSKQIQQYINQHPYGANGQPQLVDVDQDKIYDCNLVSSMGHWRSRRQIELAMRSVTNLI